MAKFKCGKHNKSKQKRSRSSGYDNIRLSKSQS